MDLLTHSRQDAFKACPRRHWYTYERGLRPVGDAKALRMGGAFHAGTECLGRGQGIDVACQAVRDLYYAVEGDELHYELETILRLVCAYDWRWNGVLLEDVATELSFELPLLNPKTGRQARGWKLAGKIDAIVLVDSRSAVKETKLLGDDISEESNLWRRLRIDHQISLYLIAARRLGYKCDTVLYDVARKPTIKPEAVPILDGAGAKIVLDRHGDRVRTERGLYRQTGDKEKGYVLQARPMTPEEWGEKLSKDIAERPDFYFARREVPRLDQDLDRYEAELWDIYQAMRDARKHGRWWRTVNRNSCPYCPYFGICSADVDVSHHAPEGFVFVTELHPELKGEPNEHCIPAETASAQGDNYF